jgi:DivIVA domain-containing protein
LTPADVRNVTFSKPPLGRPGYHEDEVDDFLDLVEAELAQLMQDNAALRTLVTQLDQQLRALSTGNSPDCTDRAADPPDADHDPPAAHVLGSAQEMADPLTDQAQAEADKILSQTRTECEQLLSGAQGKAEDLINDARTRADTMLQDARTAAQALQQQARDEAAALAQEATRQRTAILEALEQDKNLLENTIDQLRSFELEYRMKLATYLHSLIHQLDGPEFAAPAAGHIPAQHDIVA